MAGAPYLSFSQQVTTLDSLKVLGKTNIQDNLKVDKCMIVKDSVRFEKNMDVKGDTKIEGNVFITGKTTLYDELNVKKDAEFENKLKVKGETELQNKLAVKKETTFDDKITVDGKAKFENELNVKGKTKLEDKLIVKKKAKFKGNVQIDNNVTLKKFENNTASLIRPIGIDKNGIIRPFLPGDAATQIPACKTLANGLTIPPVWRNISNSDKIIYVDNCNQDAVVGIGTDNPQYKLDVNGDTRISGTLKVGNNSFYVGANTSQDHFIYTTNSPLRINGIEANNTATNGGIQNTLINPNGGRVGIGISNTPTASLQIYNTDVTHAALCIDQLVNGDYSTAFRIDVDNDKTAGILIKNGNDDVFKIWGNGVVNVSSTLYAEAVKVRIDPMSFNWPDHVFSNDYLLMELSDLENYLIEHKHLPNVPSEKEVAENGIDLGEMNAVLLQKIEELTLYVLEQQKQIEELKVLVK